MAEFRVKSQQIKGSKLKMTRTMCHAKIHRATVTQTDLHYEGSITIDSEFLEAVDLLPYEKVQVVNINNGHRAETYIIKGPAGTGVIGINGALAHHHEVGDRVIIIGYKELEEAEARRLKPQLLVLDENNHILEKVTSS
jgi:aspartate 1-decarboxylase